MTYAQELANGLADWGPLRWYAAVALTVFVAQSVLIVGFLPSARFKIGSLACQRAGEDLRDQPEPIHHVRIPAPFAAERAEVQDPDHLTSDFQRHRDEGGRSNCAQALEVGTIRWKLGETRVRHDLSPQKSGRTPREVLVDIDSFGRLWKAWPSPVVREDEGAVGQELEERAAVQSQGFDDLPLCRLDLGVDPIGRQIHESCGHVGEQALELQPVVHYRRYGRRGLVRLVLQPGHDIARSEHDAKAAKFDSEHRIRGKQDQRAGVFTETELRGDLAFSGTSDQLDARQWPLISGTERRASSMYRNGFPMRRDLLMHAPPSKNGDGAGSLHN